MTKRFEIKGFSKYCWITEDETNIDAYQLLNVDWNRIKPINDRGMYLSLCADDGKHYSRSARMFKWETIPYFIDLKKKIEAESVPVFGFEDEYMINLDTQKVWSKRFYQYVGSAHPESGMSVCSLAVHMKTTVKFLSNIVWETVHQEKLDSTKFEIRHLDFNALNDKPENLMKLPIEVNSAIKSQYNWYLEHKDQNDWELEDMFDGIKTYDIPQWKKDMLEESIINNLI